MEKYIARLFFDELLIDETPGSMNCVVSHFDRVLKTHLAMFGSAPAFVTYSTKTKWVFWQKPFIQGANYFTLETTPGSKGRSQYSIPVRVDESVPFLQFNVGLLTLRFEDV